MGYAYANYLSKSYIVSYRKMQEKKNFTVSFPGKPPLKFKKNTPKTKPAGSTAGPCPTVIGLLLRFYINVQMEWQLCRP